MKFPFDFNIKLVFRLILPGLIISTSILPLFQTTLEHFRLDVKVEAAFAFMVVFTGWLFVISDMHIYMLYEGRRYWPKTWKKLMVARQQKRVQKLFKQAQEEYKAYISDKDEESCTSKLHYQKYQELSVYLREYNINESTGCFEAMYPTRLGNILYAFETYPKRCYGMDSIFYWYRLWLLIDKDTREELDNHQSVADSVVYCSLALYTSSLLIVLQLLANKYVPNIIHYLNVELTLLLVPLTAILGYILYRLSLTYQISNGELFKSIFDDFRERIKIDEAIKSLSEVVPVSYRCARNSRSKYEMVWGYLHNYRIKVAGEAISVAEVKHGKKCSMGDGNDKTL